MARHAATPSSAVVAVLRSPRPSSDKGGGPVDPSVDSEIEPEANQVGMGGKKALRKTTWYRESLGVDRDMMIRSYVEC